MRVGGKNFFSVPPTRTKFKLRILVEKRRLKCSIFPLEHLESIIIKKKVVYQSNLIEIKQLISLKCVDFVRVGGKFFVRVSANSHFASHRAVVILICDI